jgi:hypothetical protein
MSNFIDAARFARLLRAHWAESWRGYVWFAVVAAIADLIFLFILFGSSSRNSTFYSLQFQEQIGWYATGLFATGIVFAGRHFMQLANPGAALIALMRPASHFEKCLLAFVCVGILFPLAYTVGYSLLNYPAVQLAKHLYVAPDVCKGCQPTIPDFNFYVPFLTTGVKQAAADGSRIFFRMQLFSVLVLWTLQALVLGGTVFFKRSAILKTLLLLFFLAVALLWAQSMPQLGAFWSGIDEELVPYSAFESGLSLAQWVVLPLLLWAALFFHIKEREVA